MIQDPVMHFLRVPPGSGPFAVLGLRPAEYRAGQIEQALFRQLQRIDAHADAGTPEAKQVRERVVVAARILRDPEQRDRLLREFKAIRQETEHEPALLGTEPVAAPAPRPMPRPLAPTSNGPSASSARRTERPALRLTEFDRQVLAVLVGGGGWNADSRARLVALAATYGVSVQGLIRVVTGLAAYAASGGATLGVREITAGSSRMTMARPSEDLDGPSTEREWVDRVAPEFLEGDTWSTVKLALLFSLLTLFVAIVVTRFLVQSGDATIVASNPTPAIVAPPPVVEPTVRQPAPEPEIALVTFDEFPTFQGDARPDVALEAAARSGELPGLLDALSRRLYVRTGDPSDAAYREWALLVDQAATGWVLMSDARLDAVHAGLFEVFYAAADAPTISDRLLAEVTPDPSRADVPLEVWRDAWKAGFLAKVASSQTMSPATV
ncbi:MAG: hypothetical protein KDA25_12970, partial [Phycisphaerales bacterium]|nr:hypothetical protein [Phycisphaerales bacterium]